MRRLALRLVEHLLLLTAEIDDLTTEITEPASAIAPTLLAIVELPGTNRGEDRR